MGMVTKKSQKYNGDRGNYAYNMSGNFTTQTLKKYYTIISRVLKICVHRT